MRRILWIALAAAFLPFAAQAQQALCPNYGMHALTHPAAETSYTLSSNDQCKLLVFQNTGAETVTVPNPGAFFPKGWTVSLMAQGAGGLTLQPPSGSSVTINAGSSLALAQSYSVELFNDFTNWWGTGTAAISGTGTFTTVTFGSGSTISGTLVGGSTASKIASVGASGNLMVQSSGGVVSIGGTTVANASVQVATVASSVDYLSLSGAATANPAALLLTASGTDSNIGMTLAMKGSGVLTQTGVLDTFGTASSVPMHLASAQTTAPVLTSCGTGSPAITGTDTAGIVTMGTGATGCVITFNVAYTSAPYCVVTWIATPLASQSYVTSNAAITLTQTSASGNKVQYVCIAEAGG